MEHFSTQGFSVNKKQPKTIRPLKIAFDKHGISFWYSRTNAYGYWFHSKTFGIYFYFNWMFNGVGAKWGYRDNGAKKENKDRCLDAKFTLGYVVFNYINWHFSND